MQDSFLETLHLSKRYGAQVVVDDLCLQVERGEIFGFLGPNGAGKTTSIHMMVGLLAPTSGEVRMDGRRADFNDAMIRAWIGVCPQDNILWEKLTCLEQLEFVGELYGVSRVEARRRGRQLLAELGLESKTNHLAGKLSGGMKRRLNLALGLVHDPQIIFLDEPEAGLDPQSRVLVRDYIRSLARRKTVVLTTHDMDEADRLADRVAIIDHGRLLVTDTPENLKRSLGDGDVLEIELALPAADGEALVRGLRERYARVDYDGKVLALRGSGISSGLPDLLLELRAAGGCLGEARLRGSCLEDVFLSLTGRRLRE